MNRAEALTRVAGARSGHLATVRPEGGPHVVVITFALLDGAVATAIDEKPKTTDRLQRLVNIEANPAVSFLVDHYEDDWRLLWWVRVDGTARVHDDGDTHDQALVALAAKYPQYREQPPQGPVIVISPSRLSSWAYTG